MEYVCVFMFVYIHCIYAHGCYLDVFMYMCNSYAFLLRCFLSDCNILYSFLVFAYTIFFCFFILMPLKLLFSCSTPLSLECLSHFLSYFSRVSLSVLKTSFTQIILSVFYIYQVRLPVFYFNTSKVPLLGFLIDFSQDSFPSFHTSATQVPFPFSILISSVTLFYINVSLSSSSFRFLN